MQSRFVDIGGPVHYLDFGGEGTPVVCVHGATASAATWAGVAQRLAATHRVIAPDLLGHGRTALEGRHATIAGDQRVIDGLMSQLGFERAILMSMTRGGLVSLKQAAARPQSVAGIVFNEPVALSLRHPPPANLVALSMLANWLWLTERVAGRLFRVRDGATAVTREWLRISCAHPDAVGKDQVRLLVDTADEQLRQHSPLRGWGETFKELGPLLLSGGVMRAYDSFDQPALVVIGKDTITSSLAAIADLAGRHPGWAVKALDGVGHPPLEAPDLLAQIVGEWISVDRGMPRR